MPAGHRLADGVLLTEADGRRYATDTGKGAIYEMNETAWAVLQSLADPAGAAAGLASAYPEVPRSEIEADVRDLLCSLEGRGLVVRSPA